MKTYEIREIGTDKVVHTVELSEKGLDGMYQRMDFDRFYIEEAPSD